MPTESENANAAVAATVDVLATATVDAPNNNSEDIILEKPTDGAPSITTEETTTAPDATAAKGGEPPAAANEQATATVAKDGSKDDDKKKEEEAPPQKKKSTTAKKTAVKSSSGKTTTKRKRSTKKTTLATPSNKPGEMYESSADEEDLWSGKDAIPFTIEEHPQLSIDNTKDYTSLASSFKKPLYNEPSRSLEIAYSQQAAARRQRQCSQRKKNAILKEYNALRDKFLQKKLELSLANDEIRGHSHIVGAWTRKVFDLELEEEPCPWNTNFGKLKEYKEEHGKLPPNIKKANGEDEKSLSMWLDRIRSNRTQEEKEDASEEPKKKYRSNKKFVKDYPHRLERLAELGVIFESHHENKWETMFQKLCIYKEEHGTLRFPSEDQCTATGDPELIALQKWVKRQVNAFRYGKKGNPEIVKRLLDIGFDFEKWYARPCKVKKMKGEELKKFNEIAKSTVNGMELDENDDKKMPAKEDVGDSDMKIGASEEV